MSTSDLNNKLNIVIAEDHPAQAEAMAAMLKSLRPNWRVVATPTSAPEVLEVIDRYQPDLVLLDIGLSNSTSGLTVAKEVSRHCPIIFITGEPAHALDAFELGAADYMVKPMRLARLEQAILRAERLLSDSTIRVGDGGESPRAHNLPRYVQLASGNRLIWTAVSEIRFLQAEGGYTNVFIDGVSGLIRHSLQRVYERLDKRDFWQIHRSAIVNASYVEEVERDEMGRLTLRLKGYSKRLIVARNQERLFRDDFLA